MMVIREVFPSGEVTVTVDGTVVEESDPVLARAMRDGCLEESVSYGVMIHEAGEDILVPGSDRTRPMHRQRWSLPDPV